MTTQAKLRKDRYHPHPGEGNNAAWNRTHKAILELLISNTRMKRKEITDRLGISRTTLRYHLDGRKLCGKKCTRKGFGKSVRREGHYLIYEPNARKAEAIKNLMNTFTTRAQGLGLSSEKMLTESLLMFFPYKKDNKTVYHLFPYPLADIMVNEVSEEDRKKNEERARIFLDNVLSVLRNLELISKPHFE
jgi:hypothetical protein